MILTTLAFCVGIAVAFVAVIQIGTDGRDRNDPAVARMRCVRVLMLSAATPVFVYFVYDPSGFPTSTSFFEVIGLRSDGLLPACTLPLALTALFFLGPLVDHFIVDGYYGLLMQPHFWLECLRDPLYVRDHLCAPLVEEVCFRACFLALLYPPLGALRAAVVGPLLFGICHLHHVRERSVRFGWPRALAVSAFQLLYTTVFGIYVSFVFLRSGHLAPCVLIHSFCNYMGVPTLPDPAERPLVASLYVVGIVGSLLATLSGYGDALNPGLYANSVYSQ